MSLSTINPEDIKQHVAPLIFERSSEGIHNDILSPCDVPVCLPPTATQRQSAPHFPQISEGEISRHYTELAKRTHGVNDGFYPLGSCTMKYNPQVDEDMAALEHFTRIHPLQPQRTAQGCMQVLYEAEKRLCAITGMDVMSFQPAAGAHGEFLGLLLMKAYHLYRGNPKRTKIIVPDSAHGTNPASANMCNFEIVNVPSDAFGCVDLDALRAVVGEDTAGLMLTNPNTLGIFDRNISEITRIVHEAGGLNYYDGANLNAIMGIVRPGDMGFDIIHLNLHKTFATPHGGGGPGSGPVGCKKFLTPFLPADFTRQDEEGFYRSSSEQTLGRIKAFYGNFLVVVKALTYLTTLGSDGIVAAAHAAVLNANYLRIKLAEHYDIAYEGICMHEFVLSLAKLKHEAGVSAMDVAKSLLDYGIHPPTMYFPLNVEEALMVEPTETEGLATLDQVAEIFAAIKALALTDPDKLHAAPTTTPIGRPDDVAAARSPKLRHMFN